MLKWTLCTAGPPETRRELAAGQIESAALRHNDYALLSFAPHSLRRGQMLELELSNPPDQGSSVVEIPCYLAAAGREHVFQGFLFLRHY